MNRQEFLNAYNGYIKSIIEKFKHKHGYNLEETEDSISFTFSDYGVLISLWNDDDGPTSSFFKWWEVELNTKEWLSIIKEESKKELQLYLERKEEEEQKEYERLKAKFENN